MKKYNIGKKSDHFICRKLLKETKKFLLHPLVKLSILGSPAQFSLCVHKSGIKPDSFHYINLYNHGMSLHVTIFVGSDVFSQGMREYGDGTQTVRQTTRGKLITYDPKFRTQF